MTSATSLRESPAWNLPSVEPVRRMVGGRYGWAFHRFPIKGGITPLKAMQILVAEDLQAAINRPSLFARLLAVEGGPIQKVSK